MSFESFRNLLQGETVELLGETLTQCLLGGKCLVYQLGSSATSLSLLGPAKWKSI